jgi:hypothetical protein
MSASRIPEPFKSALERLIQIAQSGTGQSRKVANFLLAWWNASENGGFDLVDVWGVDAEIARDMLHVFQIIIASHAYPDSLGYGKDFERIWELWRETKEATGVGSQPKSKLCQMFGKMLEPETHSAIDAEMMAAHERVR